MNRTHTVTALALALTALLGGLAACASGSGPTEPVSSAPSLSTSSYSSQGGMVTCGAQAYAKTVQTVGVKGAVINAGKHQLWIPANALSKTVTITMEQMADTIVNVRFSPDGLTFNPAWQPTLTMSIKGCTVPAGTVPGIAYVDDKFNVISLLTSTYNSSTAKVGAYLPHFSRYAVHH